MTSVGDADDRTVLFACPHLRLAAAQARADLKDGSAWGEWQWGSMIGGLCDECAREREEAKRRRE